MFVYILCLFIIACPINLAQDDKHLDSESYAQAWAQSRAALGLFIFYSLRHVFQQAVAVFTVERPVFVQCL